jgi:nitric oxide reductase NorQ protein
VQPEPHLDLGPTGGTTPYYVPIADERETFRAAFDSRRPVLLKGPTGVGKTRLVEAMAHELGLELITVACHEDLTAADLVGRFLLRGDETVWVDGPLTDAVRRGALCYLDEIVEARQDTTVVLHPLTDHRRLLPMERLGTTIAAHERFFLVVSYNPGYQSLLKELKPSTRQRFVAIELGFPPPDVERAVVVHEAGVDEATADRLVALASALRRSQVSGLRETASTRTLVAAGALSVHGLPLARAARAAIAQTLTDDPELVDAINELIDAYIAT